MTNHHHLDNCSIRKTVKIHHRNLKALAIEICRVIQGISPSLLNEVFMTRQCNYDLRENKFFER